MKICFVCCEYPPGPHGGIGTFTQVLARAMVGAGHHVRVVGNYSENYSAPDYQEDGGVKVFRFRKPRGRLSDLRSRWHLYRTIRKWARAGDIDLVEVPDWKGLAAFWPGLPVPVVVRANGSVTYFGALLGKPVGLQMRLYERSSLRRADCWCAVSRFCAEQTRQVFGVDSQPFDILWNPVEVPSEPVSLRRSSGRVVFTGTLTEKKGVISLIDAWPIVVHRFPHAELHVFGKDNLAPDGSSMLSFLKLRLHNGDTGSVEFHGHVAREVLFEALAEARVAVFPSYAEALPLAPLEAMARACPTILSRTTAGREIVDDMRNGLLIDPGSPQAIAEAIVRLLSDDSLALQLGRKGRETVVSRFSVQVLLPRNETFFRRAISEYRGRKQ